MPRSATPSKFPHGCRENGNILATELGLANGPQESGLTLQAKSVEGGAAGETESCTDWLSTSRPVQGGARPDPWGFTKWTPRVSPCLVAGLPIEELDAHLNFRRGWTLGFTEDVEDKTQVLPLMRGAMDPTMHARERRVFLDLGAKEFNTSVTWFLQMYPLDFTEIHAVEARPDVFQTPSPTTPKVLANGLGLNSRLRPRRGGPADFPKWLLQRVHPYNFYVSSKDNQERNMVNVTRWFLEDLKLKEEDSVVVKMDIEGHEWAILQHWLSNPRMAAIVDELFVEVHYHHPTMTEFTWTAPKFNHTRQDTTRLLTDLRKAGFYVHPWP
ncbi:unnamed protein product [Closterium sp. NIES-54]